MKIQQILFPVDLTESSIAVAKHVSAMAALFQAKIAIVHAAEDPLKWFGSTDPIKTVETDLPRALEEAELAVWAFAQAEFPDRDVSITSELASPLELIERIAKSISADLIMMPTRGRGRFRAALLGSLTAEVLHDLAVPVWTEVHSEQRSIGGHLPIRTVACAVDLQPGSVQVVRSACDLAARCGAVMFIVHGVPTAEMLLGPYSKIEPPVYMEDFARSEIEKIQQQAGTSAEVWLESGPIATVARKAAAEKSADLMVIGRGRIGHNLEGLAAHAYGIVREAPCPVLSL